MSPAYLPQDTRYKCVCATCQARLLSRALQVRYISTLRIQDLISPKCALPSELLKNSTAFNAGDCHFQTSIATAERCHLQSIGARNRVAGPQVAVSTPAPTDALPIPDASPLIPDTGGAGRDRTDGLLLAKQALSQLSYSPRR